MGCECASCCGCACCCTRADAKHVKYVYCIVFLATACLMWGLRDYPIDDWIDLPGFDICQSLPEADASKPNSTVANLDDIAVGGSPPSRRLHRMLLQGSGTDAAALPPPPPKKLQPRLTRSTCLGKNAVLRVSMGSFMFFFLMSMTLVGVKRKTPRENLGRDFLHTGMWPLKIILWGLCLFVPFLMPRNVIHVYAEFSRIGAGLFLLVQLFIILEFIYDINERLLDESSYPGLAKTVLVVATTVEYLGGLGGIGAMYYYFAPHADCSLNIFFITFTLIMAVGYTVLSVSKIREDSGVRASIFTSGCIFAYSVYLCASAIMSEPVEDEFGTYSRCNTMERHTGETGTTEVISFLLVLLAVTISTMSAGSDKNALSTLAPTGEADELPYRPDMFHIIFALASTYMAMLLTGWNLNGAMEEWTLDEGWESVWVKIVVQWMTVTAYVFTVVAPLVCKGRDFS